MKIGKILTLTMLLGILGIFSDKIVSKAECSGYEASDWIWESTYHLDEEYGYKISDVDIDDPVGFRTTGDGIKVQFDLSKYKDHINVSDDGTIAAAIRIMWDGYENADDYWRRKYYKDVKLFPSDTEYIELEIPDKCDTEVTFYFSEEDLKNVTKENSNKFYNYHDLDSNDEYLYSCWFGKDWNSHVCDENHIPEYNSIEPQIEYKDVISDGSDKATVDKNNHLTLDLNRYLNKKVDAGSYVFDHLELSFSAEKYDYDYGMYMPISPSLNLKNLHSNVEYNGEGLEKGIIELNENTLIYDLDYAKKLFSNLYYKYNSSYVFVDAVYIEENEYSYLNSGYLSHYSVTYEVKLFNEETASQQNGAQNDDHHGDDNAKDSSASEVKKTENKTSDNKASENKTTENNSTEAKKTENKNSDSGSSVTKTPTTTENVENKTTENKTTENKSTEVKPVETVALENSTGTTTSVGKVKSLKVKNKKSKKVTVSFEKISGAKYQIQYSTSKKFKKGNKTKTVSKNSVTISKLKKNKKYYFRVRAFKTVNGEKITGKWSSVKSVKIKK